MLGINYNIEQNSLLLSRREHRALTVNPNIPIVNNSFKLINALTGALIDNNISYSLNSSNLLIRSLSRLREEREWITGELENSPIAILSDHDFNFIVTQTHHISEEWVCVARINGNGYKNNHIFVPVSEAERASEIIKSMIV